MTPTIALVLALAPAPADPSADSRAIEPEAPTSIEAATAEEPTPAPVDGATTPATEEPTPVEPTEAEPEQETIRAKVSAGNKQKHAPYYDAADIRTVRTRHGLDPDMRIEPRKAKWRCLIADPVCGFNVEVNATSAFAERFKQGNVDEQNVYKWASGRAQYDVWVNIPVLVETVGRQRFTKITLGPKAGVIFSNSGDTWGNFGLALRYWLGGRLGRTRFAPTLELTSALAFKLARRDPDTKKYEMDRGPVGIAADVGFGLGGFGAIIVGGQYDSPLAREDVDERYRTSSGGMFFVGFRGNILWGAPAAAAVMTHGLTQRYGKDPY